VQPCRILCQHSAHQLQTRDDHAAEKDAILAQRIGSQRSAGIDYN
jgi:hypothetical protein